MANLFSGPIGKLSSFGAGNFPCAITQHVMDSPVIFKDCQHFRRVVDSARRNSGGHSRESHTNQIVFAPFEVWRINLLRQLKDR